MINKHYLTKESTRIKQVWKDQGYQECITTNIFKTITKNYNLCQSPNTSHRF